MASFKIVMLLVAVTACYVSARPTHCDRHKGDSEFRCAKDNYRGDRIHIRNIVGGDIGFKVGKWLSTCGRAGTNYADNHYSLGAGGTIDIDFSEVGPNACNEFFIYSCTINNRGANCLDALTPSPA